MPASALCAVMRSLRPKALGLDRAKVDRKMDRLAFEVILLYFHGSSWLDWVPAVAGRAAGIMADVVAEGSIDTASSQV